MARRRALVWLVAALPLLAGCQKPQNSVSGNVTYLGAPIEKGQITFTPVEGKGAVVGADIKAGKYKVVKIAPVKMRVDISSFQAVHFAKTHAEMAEAAKHPAAEPEMADIVPFDAEGNGQLVDIVPGEQAKDFDLKRPKGQ